MFIQPNSQWARVLLYVLFNKSLFYTHTHFIQNAAGYSEESTLKHDEHGVKLEELSTFRFMILSNATENFNRAKKLGQGGFGLVYKVFLLLFQDLLTYYQFWYSISRNVIP